MTASRGGDPPYISGKVASELRALLRTLHAYLLLADDDVFVIVLGAVAAFLAGLDPVWLLIVGPSSGAKTAFVQMFDDVAQVYRLSDLTPQTLASGYIANSDASLLPRLDGKILVLKDLTTILQMRRDDRAKVLAQFREIYDGQFNMAWGTGQELDWSGRMGLLAGVTPVIDTLHGVMGMLGQRFVLVRPEQPDRQKAACRAINNEQRGDQEAREAIAAEVARFLAGLPAAVPTLRRKGVAYVAEVADLVTRARSPVIRHGYTRDIEDTPEPEMPARFARQLAALACGIALVRGHRTVTKTDLRLISRVGANCLPPGRGTVLRAMTGIATVLRLEQIAHAVEVRQTARGLPAPSDTAIRRTLEDLHALGVLEQSGKGPGSPTVWSIHSAVRPSAEAVFGAP